MLIHTPENTFDYSLLSNNWESLAFFEALSSEVERILASEHDPRDCWTYSNQTRFKIQTDYSTSALREIEQTELSVPLQVPLDSGNSGVKTFPPIIEAVLPYVAKGESNRYLGTQAIPSVLEAIGDFLTEYKITHGELHKPPAQYNLSVGNGSTQLFEHCLREIVQNPGDVILVPVPTYGLFLPAILDTGAQIVPIPVYEDPECKLRPRQLEAAIDGAREYIERYTREHSITSESQIPKVRAFLHINPHVPSGAVYSQEEVNDLDSILESHPEIYILNDMSHLGIAPTTEMSPTVGSIHRSREIHPQAITFLSLSKAFGAADYHFGAMISSDWKLYNRVNHRLLYVTSFEPMTAQLAATAAFGSKTRELRGEFFSGANQMYSEQCDLLRTLIDGEEKADLPSPRREAVRSFVTGFMQRATQSPQELQDKSDTLLSGIPGLEVAFVPQGSFFLTVDGSGLVGKYIGDRRINSIFDLHLSSRFFADVGFLPDQLIGLDQNLEDSLPQYLRMTYALDKPSLYLGMVQMSQFVHTLIHDKPYAFPRER